MDECLDWQGQLLPNNHPYNFRTFMEKHFYGDIDPEFAVPLTNRYWLSPVDNGDGQGRNPIGPDRHYDWRLGTGRSRRI